MSAWKTHTEVLNINFCGSSVLTIEHAHHRICTIESCHESCLSCIGGSYRSWKKRYFVLKEATLEYYTKENDKAPQKSIDLKTGRGIRTRNQCDLEWPDKAKPGRCFGIALESRTFYLYGDDAAAIR